MVYEVKKNTPYSILQQLLLVFAALCCAQLITHWYRNLRVVLRTRFQYYTDWPTKLDKGAWTYSTTFCDFEITLKIFKPVENDTCLSCLTINLDKPVHSGLPFVLFPCTVKSFD